MPSLGALHRILIVDDEQEFARGLRRELEQRLPGTVVDAVYDGETAIDLISEHHYDVCVLDWFMEPMGGAMLLQQAHTLRSTPSMIVISASMDVQATVQAMTAGARDVLQKPLDTETLVAALARLGTIPSALDARAGKLLVGSSQAMVEVRRQLQRFATFSDVPMLISGETGTGKELASRYLHELTRPDQPYVTVNCAAIPEALLESELFGHEAGSFTGARQRRIGLIEAAAGGTLFLDEIGEMPRALQPKLLRVLEDGTYRRVGSNKLRRFTARLVSATNQSLGDEDSPLRSDLYFRLAGCLLRMPPLRHRTQDIDDLAKLFLGNFAERYGRRTSTISARALEMLHAYHWPGNVRELRRVIEHAAMLAETSVLTAEDVSQVLRDRVLRDRLVKTAPPESYRTSGEWVSTETSQPTAIAVNAGPLRETERTIILREFELNEQNVSRTARRLGIPRSTLRDRLRRYGKR